MAASGHMATLDSVSEGGGLQVTYKGDGSILNFASIDKIKEEDFLKWESLSISGMDVGYNPLYVRIDGIALSQFLHPTGHPSRWNAECPEYPGKRGPPEEPPPLLAEGIFSGKTAKRDPGRSLRIKSRLDHPAGR